MTFLPQMVFRLGEDPDFYTYMDEVFGKLQ